MVPSDRSCSEEWIRAEQVMHYNASGRGDQRCAAPGFSSGQGQAAIAEVLKQKLPDGMSFEWTELAYQEILSGTPCC